MSDPHDATLQPGDLLDGRYRILSRGTTRPYGVVHMATDPARGSAVHVLLLDPLYGTGERTLELVAQTQSRVAALGQPALVAFEGVGLAAGRIFLVRRFLGGRSLASRLDRGRALPMADAVGTAQEVCQALAPLHRAGLVHGALYPESVLFGEDGRIVITDVALLPSAFPEGMAPGRPWGPLPYVSPEQATGDAAGFASDVYQVGLLLYQMLAGRPPFDQHEEAVRAAQTLGTPERLRTVAPHVPEELSTLVHQTLAAQPSARYRHAGQLAKILTAYPLPEPGPAVQAVKKRSRAVGERVGMDPGYRSGFATGSSLPARAGARRRRSMGSIRGSEPWQEPSGVDWLLVVLLIISIIALLGLIPLWWLAYQAWAPALAPLL